MLPHALTLRIPMAVCICFALLAGLPALAQKGKKHSKKEEEKIPVYNYVIDDPMDAFGRQPQPQQAPTRTVTLPEFCMHGGTVADTMYWYEHYDAAHKIINPDTLTDHTLLRYVSLMESYTDREHTYKDASGKLQPLPVSKIIYRYDRLGADKWLSVNYKTNKTFKLQDHVNDIVRRDTIRSTDGSSVIRAYYRVSQLQ
ncbi:hypothetical protein GCM10023093_19920 [Nemorincola caseinilytica]|uniref:Uncharacterized protein n=1 Tax=Nemorincola caseinilytica TaxID=2054315 RepID=A0ABP8NFP2_9BACT